MAWSAEAYRLRGHIVTVWRSAWSPERRAPARRLGCLLLAVELREDHETLKPRVHHGGPRPRPGTPLRELPGPAVREHGAHDAGTTPAKARQHEQGRRLHLQVQDALPGHL